MADHPKNAFNKHGKPNFRDQDNAAPRPKPPSQARVPAPNMAPSGSSGIHLSRYDGPQPQQAVQHQSEQAKSIVKTHPHPQLLTGGRFMDRPGTGFAVEVNPYRSPMGLDGGRLTTLEIQQEGTIIAQYQKGQWTVQPKATDHKELVDRLQNQFGGMEHTHDPIAPKDHSKDHGYER